MKRTVAWMLTAWMLVSCGTYRIVTHDDGESTLVRTDEGARKQQSEFRKWLSYGYESEHYQQDSLKMVDPRADAHLIRRLDTIPAKLYTYLFRGPLPQVDSVKEYKIGKTLPFDPERLLNQCGQIMVRHLPDIYPTLGEEHKWSPEAQRYMYYGFWHRLGRYSLCKQKDFPMPLLLRSKLFVCLACGWTARYCATGQEKALTEYILRRPDRSIRLHELFEESYVLNKGNLYLTFLTCENVLAGEPHRKGRDGDLLQKKLTYIRHDCPELGDNYGAWYHFFGIALYGMFRPDLVSRFVADTESFGSLFYEGADRQEHLINHYGAIFGSRFRRMMDEGTWGIPPRLDGRTDYMLPNSMCDTSVNSTGN